MMGQENVSCTEAKFGISGSTLKIIALITMLIDHIGAVVVLRMILDNAAQSGMVGVVPYDNLYETYQVLRSIGRIAFPIYCFLLVEGFQKTRSRKSYALRLGIFALLSEIPFNLAISSKIMNFEYQNVFFTLLIAFATMIAVDAVAKMTWSRAEGFLQKLFSGLQWLIGIAIVALGAVIAEGLHTDYGAKGVLCIMLLYLLRRMKFLQLAAGAISFVWDGIAPLAFIPMVLYNGKRGMKLKYLFYLFYPLHLLVLYLVCVAMGISAYSAV